MNFWRRKNFGWLLVALVLASCFPSTIVTPLPTTSITAASPTPFPTETALPATATPTSSPTITPTITATRPLEAGGLAIVFISKTVPDGTNLQPGQPFQKTWTLKNGGKRAWGEGFALATVSSDPAGEDLGSPFEIPLAQEVQPGEAVQISVDLVAPEQNGRYTVYYQLQDETGAPVPDSQIWVTITVGAVSSPAPVLTGMISAEFLDAFMQSSEYNISFCMELPDSRAWFLWDVTLVVDQQPISPSGGRSDPATALTDHKCFTFFYPTNGMEPGGSV